MRSIPERRRARLKTSGSGVSGAPEALDMLHALVPRDQHHLASGAAFETGLDVLRLLVEQGHAIDGEHDVADRNPGLRGGGPTRHGSDSHRAPAALESQTDVTRAEGPRRAT